MDEQNKVKGKHSKMINMLRKRGIDFERIAITDKTIEDFGLEHLKEIDDPEVLAKLKRNPNYDYFIDKHDGEVWQIELDALQLDPKQFKELVLSDVDQFWDEDIYQRALDDVKYSYPPAGIHRQLKFMIAELSKELKKKDHEYD